MKKHSFSLKVFCISAVMFLIPIYVGATIIKPVIVYSGDKSDSFHSPVFKGADKFTSDTKIQIESVLISPDHVTSAKGTEELRQVALKGYDPIIVVGFLLETATREVSSSFPDRKFIILDADIDDQPNVQSIIFKEHEGSFIMGILAAMASKTNKVGFIGGMESPIINKFFCGYKQGVNYVDLKTHNKLKTTVMADWTGNTPKAWQNPQEGYKLTKRQLLLGADVIYQAAGNSGLGVFKAVSESEDGLAIGVDANQNPIYPGRILTSMLKQLDVATYKALSSVKSDLWKSGTIALGLKEGGVGWALDQNNEHLITANMRTEVHRATKSIIVGSIKVHDYSSGACPPPELPSSGIRITE